MCGRYQLAVDPAQLEAVFAAAVTGQLRPGYNNAPTQSLPVVRLEAEGRIIRPMRWGLVPHWADDPKIGNRMINARSETVADKPAYRSAFKRNRCLVPATGFYEWKREGKAKLPHLIRVRDADVIAFAGIWSSWHGGKGGKSEDGEAGEEPEELLTFSILTTDPLGALDGLHDRMPVIVHPDRWQTWLEPETDRETLLALTRPPPRDVLEIYPVSDRLNNVRNQGPEVAERAG